MVDDDYLDDIASAFTQVMNSKSPYTKGHSERVTLFTDLIAKQMKLSAERAPVAQARGAAARYRQAGRQQLHLDKPGKLDPEEWAGMEMHAALSETILSRISAFSE